MRIRLVGVAVLLLGCLASPVAAQQPFNLAVWGGTTATTVAEVTPIPICISDKTECFTNFGEVPEFDLDLTDTELVPGYAIAIEGTTGPLAVGPNVPLPVVTTSASIISAVGNVAAGAADAGAPLKVGGIAAFSAIPVSVTNGARVNAWYDKSGRVVTTGSPRELRIAGTRVTLSASTTETTIIAAAASTFHDLIAAQCTNESATEVRIDWRDTTTGTVRFSMDLAPDGGGSNLFWGPDGYPQAAVNTNWTIQASASVSSVYCTALARKDL